MNDAIETPLGGSPGFLARYRPRQFPSSTAPPGHQQLLPRHISIDHPAALAWRDRGEHGLRGRVVAVLDEANAKFTAVCPFGVDLCLSADWDMDAGVSLVVALLPDCHSASEARELVCHLQQVLHEYVSPLH